jgi:hypothetical protein
MIPTPGSLDGRRQELSEQIARQRNELSLAYRDLTTPFHYVDTGLSGLKILRKSGWLIALAPSAVSLVFSLLGWEKKRKPGLFHRLTGRASRRAIKLGNLGEEEASRLKKPVARLAKHAWSLFQVYRKIRPFFP